MWKKAQSVRASTKCHFGGAITRFDAMTCVKWLVFKKNYPKCTARYYDW
jgi:hypothetical protein